MVEWKLAPVEPTYEMCEAGRGEGRKEFSLPEDMYRAMLAAAPQAPSGQQAEQLMALCPYEDKGSRAVWKEAIRVLAGQQSERPAPAKSKCALCGDPARIPPTCDACHDSMGTRPAPAGQAVGALPAAWEAEAKRFAALGDPISLAEAGCMRNLAKDLRAALASSQAERPAEEQ